MICGPRPDRRSAARPPGPVAVGTLSVLGVVAGRRGGRIGRGSTASRLVSRFGPGRLIVHGLVIMAGGIWMLSPDPAGRLVRR